MPVEAGNHGNQFCVVFGTSSHCGFLFFVPCATWSACQGALSAERSSDYHALFQLLSSRGVSEEV